MDYNDSRLDHYYIRYVIDHLNPPRQVFTAGPLNYEQFQNFVEKTRDPDGAITIIGVLSNLRYPYDTKGISDRRLMYKKNKK